jgi:hypothetical protein
MEIKPKKPANTAGKMTLKEVAEATGAAYSTVAAYAKKAGWTQNGKLTLLDEQQVTLILEAAKRAHNGGSKLLNNSEGYSGAHLASSLQGVETGLSKELRLAQVYKEAAALERELKEEALRENQALRAKNEELTSCLSKEIMDHNNTKKLLERQKYGTSAYQRIAESAGLVLTDREDMLSTYRR